MKKIVSLLAIPIGVVGISSSFESKPARSSRWPAIVTMVL